MISFKINEFTISNWKTEQANKPMLQISWTKINRLKTSAVFTAKSDSISLEWIRNRKTIKLTLWLEYENESAYRGGLYPFDCFHNYSAFVLTTVTFCRMPDDAGTSKRKQLKDTIWNDNNRNWVTLFNKSFQNMKFGRIFVCLVTNDEKLVNWTNIRIF